MTERRAWTSQQDKAVKYLREVLNVSKWSEISRRLENELNFPGRNGKQCRQRYTNHLDNSINFTEINLEEEQKIFKLHDLVGNKWSQICKELPGRTQNQIKNHFHSKLRKAIRKLNKQIKLHFKKLIKTYKLNIVYKIVQASDFQFFNNICFRQEFKFFNELKNVIIEYVGGIISQKSQISNLNGKEQVTFIVQKLEKFQQLMKENKFLISTDKKNKKCFDRKTQSNDKITNLTQNSSISQDEEDNEIQEKQSNFQCEGSLARIKTGQGLNGLQEAILKFKALNEDFSEEYVQENTEIKRDEEEQSQMIMLSRYQNNLKSQNSREKPELIIPEFMEKIIEEQEFPDHFLERKLSLKQYESLIEFEDKFLEDSQVNMMLRRFDGIYNIESSLFE